MLELTKVDFTESIRSVSEEPLLPNAASRKAGAAVVMVMASFLFVFSYEWYDNGHDNRDYRNNRYEDCITYTLFGYIILAGLINERLDTTLNFRRRIRLKNILKLLGASAVVVGIDLYYLI